MVVAYTYLGDVNVLIRQSSHDCFVIQKRYNLVPIRTVVRRTLQDAEEVYETFLQGRSPY